MKHDQSVGQPARPCTALVWAFDSHHPLHSKHSTNPLVQRSRSAACSCNSGASAHKRNPGNHSKAFSRKKSHGIGPVRRTIVTVLPSATTDPAVGDWLATHAVPLFAPANFATKPAACKAFAAFAPDISKR